MSGGLRPARVFLARHGAAKTPGADGRAWNYSPAGLTPGGREEAARLGEVLSGVAVDLIVASDLGRTRETAEAIAGATGAPILIDPRLREVDIGEHEGASLLSLEQDAPDFVPFLAIPFGGRFPTPDFRIPSALRFPGGESVADMLARVLPAFLEIARERQDQTSVIVSHCWVLEGLLCHITGADVDNYDRWAMPHASLTLAELSTDGRGVVHVVNGTRDLRRAAGGRLRMGQGAQDPDLGRDQSDTCRVFLVGHGDAAPLARTLRDVHIDAIYTSELLEAEETAAALAAWRGIEPTVEPALNEDVELVLDRALEAFRRIITANLGGAIAVAADRGAIQALLCHVTGGDPGQCFRFGLGQASLTLAEVDPGGRGVLEVFNGRVPLGELAGGRLLSRPARAGAAVT